MTDKLVNILKDFIKCHKMECCQSNQSKQSNALSYWLCRHVIGREKHHKSIQNKPKVSNNQNIVKSTQNKPEVSNNQNIVKSTQNKPEVSNNQNI
eukprot:365680_1